jgi:hypothetical protein
MEAGYGVAITARTNGVVVKGYGHKYCILLCYPGYDINEPYNRQPQKYWGLQ